MNSKTITLAAAAVVALGLAGCGSEDSTAAESTSSSPTATSSSAAAPLTTAPPTPAPASGGAFTLSEYLEANGVTETTARPGEAGAPTVELPVPAGWAPSADGAADAFWTVALTQAGDPANPPMMEATMIKLSKAVPIQSIFDHAAGEMMNLPGYQPLGDGGRGALGGLEAYQVGGMYEKNGVQMLVAQKTALITSPSGAYVLEVRAEGPQDDAQALVAATAALDNETVITP